MTEEYALRRIVDKKLRWVYDIEDGSFTAKSNNTVLHLKGSEYSRIYLTLRSAKPDEGWKEFVIIEPLCPLWIKYFHKERIPLIKKLLDQLLEQAQKQIPSEESINRQYEEARDELLTDVSGWDK